PISPGPYPPSPTAPTCYATKTGSRPRRWRPASNGATPWRSPRRNLRRFYWGVFGPYRREYLVEVGPATPSRAVEWICDGGLAGGHLNAGDMPARMRYIA